MLLLIRAYKHSDWRSAVRLAIYIATDFIICRLWEQNFSSYFSFFEFTFTDFYQMPAH